MLFRERYINALDKGIPVNNVLRYIIYCVLKEERISVAVERTWLSGFKLDRVYRVPEREVPRIGRDLIQPHKQLLRVGDGPNEDASRAEPARDILQHTVNFGIALERIMHAELHRNHVKGHCQLRGWDPPRYGPRITVECSERGVKA
jgi:hypothetical protein